MIFNHKEKNIEGKLKDAEIIALKKYCESQGFTEEETSVFVKNSMKMMYDAEKE